jgi:hypothetical protein
MSKPRKKKRPPKRVLALPDLQQSKTAVLNTLTSESGQRSYDRAITDFAFCRKRPHGHRTGEYGARALAPAGDRPPLGD